jgi:hypothetical protein
MNNKSTGFFLMGLLSLLLLCCVLSFLIYTVPYSRFLKVEVKALEKFAALDQNLYSQIPIPRGVTEIKKVEIKNPGLIHGSIMYVDYEMGQQDPADILYFYKAYFYEIGWDRFVLSDYSMLPDVVFYKDSACVEFFWGSYPPNSYELQIYHDYFAYEFSPTPPWIIAWHEIDNGGLKYIRCPPFLDPEY